MDVTEADRAQGFPLHIPDRITPPVNPQPAPVMDRYNGLRLDSNSFSTSHVCRAATKRVIPHADNINTIHSNRVTPRVLFEVIRIRVIETGSGSF